MQQHRTHKEKQLSKTVADAADRANIRQKLDRRTYHLFTSKASDKIVSIVSGWVAPAPVNLDKIVAIENKQKEEFEGSWSEGFFYPI
jgi:hypothetical protein